jgi:hypothetical protein
MTQPDIGERIMGLRHPENTVYRKGECAVNLRLAYSTGHKDARCAAAALATTAMAEKDAEIAQLQAKLAAVRGAWSSAIRHDGADNYSVTLNYNTLEQAEDAYKVLRAETVKES